MFSQHQGLTLSKLGLEFIPLKSRALLNGVFAGDFPSSQNAVAASKAPFDNSWVVISALYCLGWQNDI